MGFGRKRTTKKINRRRAQRKLKDRIKNKISASAENSKK